MFIGVTGQIGAGKTTAAKILASFGAAVIDADCIGREVVESSAPLRKKLAGAFGSDILTSAGSLKRRALARLAFANADNKRRLNELVHPYLLRELRRQMRQLRRQHQVVVIDAALLFDWNLESELDFVVVVHASLETRLKRLQARGISRQDARCRQRVQLPFREYQRRADYVILNNSTVEHLRLKLQRLYAKIAQ